MTFFSQKMLENLNRPFSSFSRILCHAAQLTELVTLAALVVLVCYFCVYNAGAAGVLQPIVDK
jgi:hypothetical protein